MDYFVTVKGSVLPVSVSLKKMKQVRLKVFPSGEIKLSVPTGTPEEWIAEYLNDKTGWIEEKLKFFIQTRAIEKEKHFVSGSSTRILGRQLTIQVYQARRKQIIREDSVLNVYTPETDQQIIDKQVNNWWQKTSKEYFQDVLNRLYPIVEKHGVQRPDICVKKMRTLWGSCSRTNQKINLNYIFSVKISIPLENTGVSSVFATSVWPFSLIFSLARRNEGNFFQAVPTTLSSSLAEVRLASLVAWA